MIYLDNAATSHPKPRCVYDRVGEVLREIGGNPGRGSHTMALAAARVVFSARESLSRLLNVKDSSRIVFTKNATEAVNVALKGILKKGDHVVTTSFEHNSTVKALGRLEKEGVIVTKVAGKRPDLVERGDIEKALCPKTRLVSVVHASNVFGTIEPVGEIGEVMRKRGIIFMVDGAQSVGAIPVDVEAANMDILAGTGHKALFGPQGVGFLYLRQGIEPAPLIDGGTGESEAGPEIPERLETGTINTPGIGGLGAGVEFIMKQGISKIRSREEALLGEILDGLKKMDGVRVLGPDDPGLRVSLVSFVIDGKDAGDVGARLDGEFSIMTRCGTHCAPDAHRTAGTYPGGAIRVSPGYFNTPEEIGVFLDAVYKIAGG